MGAQKNCLIETAFLNTHNICYGWVIKRIIFNYTLIWSLETSTIMSLFGLIACFGDGFFPACLDNSETNPEDLLLIPKELSEKSANHPELLIDHRDSSHQIHLEEVTGFTDKSDIQLEVKESGLGTELLSQTESESLGSEIDEIEVSDIDSEHLVKKDKVDVSVESGIKEDRLLAKGTDHNDSIPYIYKAMDGTRYMIGDGPFIRMSGENEFIDNEDDMIEFENVNVRADFDEASPFSSGLKMDIDQNNQNSQNKGQFQKDLKNQSTRRNYNESLEMSHDLECILDDLDSHLEQSFDNNSRNSKTDMQSCNKLQSKHNENLLETRSHQSHSQAQKASANGIPALTSRMVDKDGSALGSFSKLNDQKDLIGEHKTPPFKGEFSHAVDSIYVTKKRSVPSSEKHANETPESTPLRPLNYYQLYSYDPTRADENAKNSAARKSVCFSSGSEKMDHIKHDRYLPKQGISALSTASPNTYFASLEKSGHLSPFIKSIAQKYGLFGSSGLTDIDTQEESFDVTDIDFDESYASTLLGKSGDLDDSGSSSDFQRNNIKVLPAVASSYEEHADNELDVLDSDLNVPETVKDNDVADPEKISLMINNYLTDVLGSTQSSEAMDINSCIDQFVDKIIFDCQSTMQSEHQLRRDGENGAVTSGTELQSDGQDHESELSDLEFYSDSVLLCITQGSDESPPLSSCSPSLYPSCIDPQLYEAPNLPQKSESAVVGLKENECHWFSRKQAQTPEHESCMFRPVEIPKPFHNIYVNNVLAEDDSILSQMMMTSSHDAKLPDSGQIRQTSSYCRIPFGSSNAPSFWFKKDFAESPKPKKTSRHKLDWKAKSPGKRSFSNFHKTSSTEKLYQVPTLAKLAEQVHLSLFRKRLDAIIRKHSIETSGDSVTSNCVRSPAKKRRRKQTLEHVHYQGNTSNSAYTSVEEGSVEIYFTNLLDNADRESMTSVPVFDGIHHKSSAGSPKVDWARTLFGPNSDESGTQKDKECTKCLSSFPEKDYGFHKKSDYSENVSCSSPFVSPFKSDRHFRQRPVHCQRPNSFHDDCSEKRRRQKFRSKVYSSKSEEPVTLTGYRRLSSLKGHRDPAALAVKVFNERREYNALERQGFDASSFLRSSVTNNEGTSDISQGRSECSIDTVDSDTVFFRDIGHQDISTLTNYSEGDLCGTSDFSENISYSQGSSNEICDHDTVFSVTTQRSADRKPQLVPTDTEDDICYNALSMFHRTDSDCSDSDEKYTPIDPAQLSVSDQLNLSNTVEEQCAHIEEITSKIGESPEAKDGIDADVSVYINSLETELRDVERKIEDLEMAVKNHYHAANDSAGNVVNMTQTRGTMYEAIHSVVKSCSDALQGNDILDVVEETQQTSCKTVNTDENEDQVDCDHKNDWDMSLYPDNLLRDLQDIDLSDTPQYVVEETQQTCCNTVNTDENEDQVDCDPKNDWDMSPDPDNLLRDLQDIDLSDTPQYVGETNTDNEIKQFLDSVLQPFDDMFADSLSSTGESPIQRTSTKNSEFNDDICDDSAVNDALSAEPETVLNRSFMEDECKNKSDSASPANFEPQNASSTPIYEHCSPPQVPESLVDIKPVEAMKSPDFMASAGLISTKEAMKSPDTEEESFASATSSRTNQYNQSKSTTDSFDSFQTGIDKSSMLGWSEEDTLNANSDLESFCQSLPKYCIERTCIGESESQNRMEDPLWQDRAASEKTCTNRVKAAVYNYERRDVVDNGGQGDVIVDPGSVEISLQDEATKWQEDIDKRRDIIQDFPFYQLASLKVAPALSRKDNSQEFQNDRPNVESSVMDRAASNLNVSPRRERAAHFYVGSSQESNSEVD